MNTMTETKPRREWRVTKADLEAQVVGAAAMAELRAEECARLREQIAHEVRMTGHWRRACYALTILPVVALGLALW